MNYFAHSAVDAAGRPRPACSGAWQPLEEHLRRVGTLAKEFAAPFALAPEAEIAGLLHDLGKYAQRFQERLQNPRIHGVNHWSVGAFQAWELGWRAAALAIEGHHTGLPALKTNHEGQECWQQRFLKLRDPATAALVSGFPESAAELLARLIADGVPAPTRTPPASAAGREFSLSLLIRLLFSCLVDADFLDTEQHFAPDHTPRPRAPALEAPIALRHLLDHLKAKPLDGSVNRLRRTLLADCLAGAETVPGLFTLTAPTGSGKTLASLAFALKHIAHHNAGLAPDNPQRLHRVIVVIPYTSIIEQTAAVYRKLFEPHFGPDYVLEHHSAVVPRASQDQHDQEAEDQHVRRARLASENWDAPLIVTTSLQFFESLFAHRPSDCRKLHHVPRSVILFDEVQTLPREHVPSLLSAVRLLTQEPYGATAVFMTATQPAFGAAAHAILGGWAPVELSSNPGAMADAFQRVQLVRKPDDWRPTWPEVAAALSAEPQALVVVNTKAAARALFQALPPEGTFHLSTALCAAHRQQILAEVRRRLVAGEPCRLVSTQLIEAGVDIDFPVVWRALGPLDSIIQTAGRCNREGKLPAPGRVVVFRPAEHRLPPGAYRQAAAVTEAFLAEHPDCPLHRPETYAAYFRQLYAVGGPRQPQDDTLFKACADFDFPAAAQACRLIGDETRGVLVSWGEGVDLIAAFRAEHRWDATLFRRCQRFTVNLYLGEFLRAEQDGVISPLTPDGSLYVWSSKYDPHLGATHHSSSDLIL